MAQDDINAIAARVILIEADALQAPNCEVDFLGPRLILEPQHFV